MSKQNQSNKPTKESHRLKTWEDMMDNDLVNFPLITYYRIPNFKGADEAAKRLAELDEFKNARVIKINPDKSQEPVRLAALEAGKEILMPSSRLKSGLFFHLVPPAELPGKFLKRMATCQGIHANGKPVDIDSGIKVDLVVLGAVCVSRKGYRIGRGEGFSDLEFAMMMKMRAVCDKTIVVTTIHDCQLVDSLEDELFEEHDVPVDIIVTPTQTIFINERLRKPSDINWHKLTPRLVTRRMLEQLNKIKSNEKDLAEEMLTNNAEPERQQKSSTRRKKRKKKITSSKEGSTEPKVDGENKNKIKGKIIKPSSKSSTKPNVDGQTENGVKQKNKIKKYSSRKRQLPKSSQNVENGSDSTVSETNDNVIEELSNDKSIRRQPMKFRPRSRIDFSLKLSNVGSNVRVRDLKNVLAQRGVKPSYITWGGKRGFCYLHFSKLKKKNSQPNEAIQVDSIVGNLQQLYIGDSKNISNENLIIVEPAGPITRIETTDVTSV